MTIFAQVRVSDVTVTALDRLGGHSSIPFDSLNVADYVGDDEMCVASNIALVAECVGATDVAVMNAEHGNRVTKVSGGGKCEPADVIVTSTPGLALLALAADCVPVALVGRDVNVVAAVHIGWKGLLAGVIDSSMQAMVQSGAQPTHMTAVIGPSICGSCYEVSTDLAHRIAHAYPTAWVDERHVNLARAVSDGFAGFGVHVEQIPGCTYESENLFSYRRAAGSPTGRGGLVVMLPSVGDERG